MKAICPFCKEPNVKVLSTGKLNNHYPSAKTTLTPTRFCEGSGYQSVSAETFTCTQCGREEVDIDDEGRFHFHTPLKEWGGAKRGCRGSNQKEEDLPKEELSYNAKLSPGADSRYKGPREIHRD